MAKVKGWNKIAETKQGTIYQNERSPTFCACLAKMDKGIWTCGIGRLNTNTRQFEQAKLIKTSTDKEEVRKILVNFMKNNR